MAEQPREACRLQIPEGRPGYLPVPPVPAQLAVPTVCGRCGALVPRFAQDIHDRWHASHAGHQHPPSVPVVCA